MAASHNPGVENARGWLPPESTDRRPYSPGRLCNPGIGKPVHAKRAENRRLYLQGARHQACIDRLGQKITGDTRKCGTELRYATGPYTIPPFKNLPSDARMVKLVDTRDLK